jgi:hypothetical protein
MFFTFSVCYHLKAYHLDKLHPIGEKFLQNDDFPKLQFWKIYLRFMGKSGLQAAFSRAFHKTNRVLGKAQIYQNFT